MSTIAGHETEKDLTGCFIRRDGIAFARTHLIVDLWEAWRLDDQRMVERTFRMAAKAARPTLLEIDLHAFPRRGVSHHVAFAIPPRFISHCGDDLSEACPPALGPKRTAKTITRRTDFRTPDAERSNEFSRRSTC